MSENLPEYIKRENEDARIYGKWVFIQLYKYVSERPNNSPNGLSCTGGFSQKRYTVNSPGPYVATCMINGIREKFDAAVVSNNTKIYRFYSNKSTEHEGNIITVQ